MILPIVTIGGEQFFDISGIVHPDRYLRPLNEVLVLHHTVAQTEFYDANMNGTTMDEEIAHIENIDAYHWEQGYGGFGYQAIAFQSGRVYTVACCAGARAHVAGENWRYAGIAMAGRYTTTEPAKCLMLGVGRWVFAMWKQYGCAPLKGHREVGQSTCPGDGGMAAMPKILRYAKAVAANRQQAAGKALAPPNS